MNKLRKPCEHWAVAYVGCKSAIIRLAFLEQYCRASANIHWVGLGEPPEKEIQKVLKEFRKFNYCPKCGEKLDFDGIAERRMKKEKGLI